MAFGHTARNFAALSRHCAQCLNYRRAAAFCFWRAYGLRPYGAQSCGVVKLLGYNNSNTAALKIGKLPCSTSSLLPTSSSSMSLHSSCMVRTNTKPKQRSGEPPKGFSLASLPLADRLVPFWACRFSGTRRNTRNSNTAFQPFSLFKF